MGLQKLFFCLPSFSLCCRRFVVTTAAAIAVAARGFLQRRRQSVCARKVPKLCVCVCATGPGAMAAGRQTFVWTQKTKSSRASNWFVFGFVCGQPQPPSSCLLFVVRACEVLFQLCKRASLPRVMRAAVALRIKRRRPCFPPSPPRQPSGGGARSINVV